MSWILGIQFGFALQGGNMSHLETLGASPEELPGLWIAAPLTKLLVQPIIGYWVTVRGARSVGGGGHFMIGAI